MYNVYEITYWLEPRKKVEQSPDFNMTGFVNQLDALHFLTNRLTAINGKGTQTLRINDVSIEADVIEFSFLDSDGNSIASGEISSAVKGCEGTSHTP